MKYNDLLKKLRHNIVWIALLTFGLLSAGEMLIGWAFPISFMPFGLAFSVTFNQYFAFISIWLSVVAWCVIFPKNRYILGKLKYARPERQTRRWLYGNTGRTLLIGLLIGFLTNGLCAAVAMLNGDIQIAFLQFDPLAAIVMFLAVFIQSSAEEVLCRGFMLERLREDFDHPWYAVIVVALFFGAIHLGNAGIGVMAFIDLVLFGILSGMMVICFDSLWMAMAYHAAWNYMQAIVLGLPNSGNVAVYSFYTLDMGTARNSFAYDTAFGIEGTVLSILLMALTCVGIWWLRRRRSEVASA